MSTQPAGTPNRTGSWLSPLSEWKEPACQRTNGTTRVGEASSPAAAATAMASPSGVARPSPSRISGANR